MTYDVISETASVVFLNSSFKVKNLYKDILFKLSLFYDNIHIPSLGNFDLERPPFSDLNPIAKFLFIDLLGGRSIRDYRIHDLGRIINGVTLFGNGRSTPVDGITIYRAYQNHWHLFVWPTLQESALDYVLKIQPKYGELMKESLLLMDLLDFIFEEHLSAFDFKRMIDSIEIVAQIKKDIQKGFMEIVKGLKGSYFLSEEQKKEIRRRISQKQQLLYQFLDPEALRKKNISKAIIDLSKNLLLDMVPIFPADSISDIISFINDVKQIKEFQSHELDFILALNILKKVTVSTVEDFKMSICVICSRTYQEIEDLPDEEVKEIVFDKRLCEEHMFLYLTIRKKFSLMGKALLLSLKDPDRFFRE